METILLTAATVGIAIIAQAAHESRNILKKMMKEYDHNNDLPKV